MIVVDDVVVNPVEAPSTPAREEKSLSEMGLSVIGADWGESAIEGTVRRTASGQVMSDRKGKPRTITLVLMVREESGVDLPTAAHYFQQIVGELQRRETWIRRDPLLEDHAGPVLFRISGEVGVRDFLGWQKGESPDVTLTMVSDFAGYSTEEEEHGPFQNAEGERHVLYMLPSNKGTAQGRKRIHVDNQGDEDWRGLLWAEEDEDGPEDINDPTAALAYRAADLTPLGGSEVETVGEENVVVHNALSAGWLAVLGSEIDGVGHMTHRGARRPLLRVEDPGSTVGDVQLRLIWRALGASRWCEDNRTISVPLIEDWALIDLDECRLQDAVLGDQRWEWRLMARALSGSGALRVQDFYPLPANTVRLSAPPVVSYAETQEAKDPEQAESAEGAGGIWASPNNVKTSNDNRATAPLETVKTPVAINLTQELWVTDFGFDIQAGAAVTGVVAELERSAEGEGWIKDRDIHLLGGSGLALSRGKPDRWPTSDEIAIYGGSTDLWGLDLDAEAVNSTGFGIAITCTGVRPATARIDHVRLTIYYAGSVDSNRVCFASRAFELRSDGAYREDVDGTNVWGAMTPDGFLPVAQPGAVRRGIVIASVGDLDHLPDAAVPQILVHVYERAGHLYTLEAA